MNKEQEYFEWLCGIVCLSEVTNPARTHIQMLELLFKTEFKWILDMDENRAEDGVILRDEFCDEVGSWDGCPMVFEPCNWLEFLIGLSKRLAYQDSDNLRVGAAAWFWRLAWNAGLIVYDDEAWGEMDSPKHVRNILDRISQRRFDWDGRGGLFPLNNPRQDQRDAEIWEQMSAYLQER